VDQYGYGYPPPAPVPPQRTNATLAIVLGAAGLAVVIAAGAVTWVLVVSRPGAPRGVGAARPGASPSGSTGPTPGPCRFHPVSSNADRKSVGVPDLTGERRTGTVTMTITTNLGVIEVRMDAAKTPCTIASFALLAGRHFFDNSACHRLVNQDRFGVLQCGDPSGTGGGGPAYEFPDENLTAVPVHRVPAAGSTADAPPGIPAPQTSSDVVDQPYYRRGMVAMANSGPNTNSSQFFLVFRDSDLRADYTPFGEVTRGVDILDQVAAGGEDGAWANTAGGGHPKTRIVVQSLTMT
jgi:peptidyl-prolyl cis-trans isomerase B (cyclophilin B)